jgi:predicted Zn-dependent protease
MNYNYRNSQRMPRTVIHELGHYFGMDEAASFVFSAPIEPS